MKVQTKKIKIAKKKKIMQVQMIFNKIENINEKSK